MRKSYLLLCNLDALNAIQEKIEAVQKHILPIKNKMNKFKKFSIQSLICSICKLLAGC